MFLPLSLTWTLTQRSSSHPSQHSSHLTQPLFYPTHAPQSRPSSTLFSSPLLCSAYSSTRSHVALRRYVKELSWTRHREATVQVWLASMLLAEELERLRAELASAKSRLAAMASKIQPLKWLSD